MRIQWTALFGVVSCALMVSPSLAQSLPESTVEPEEASEEEEEAPARGYLGIGGNIGFSGGQTALSEGGFVIINRTRIIDYLSVRSSTVFGDETTSAIALTGEYEISNAGGRTVATPFLGAGIAIANDVSPLVSAGVDVPLGKDFVLTNRLNVSFGDEETDVGVVVGVGYNFSLLELF